MYDSYPVLIVDDEKGYRDIIERIFKKKGFHCKTVSSGDEALALMSNSYYPIVITDIMMDGINGIELLKTIKKIYGKDVEVIILTGFGSVESAVETLKLGAFGYCIKSHDPEALILEVEKAVAKLKCNIRSALFAQQKQEGVLESKNPRMQGILESLSSIAKSDANVLITGESGTGKEIIANRLHNLSMRREFPFVPINCQSYPLNLIESELFGHEKGAFTGASDRRIGKLEQCNGGTLFLDEIGDMSREVQVKFLRVLENRKIERIGSNKSINVDFRLISATNRNIGKDIGENLFREDLYYRINTFEIKLPPLRERKEDIPNFVDYFIAMASEKQRKTVGKLTEKALESLMMYDFPGNIRELRNIIERMVILTPEGEDIEISEGFKKGPSKGSSDDGEIISYKEAKNIFEREYILKVLRSSDFNITRSADKMGLSRRQLFNKMKELKIKVPDDI